MQGLKGVTAVATLVAAAVALGGRGALETLKPRIDEKRTFLPSGS